MSGTHTDVSHPMRPLRDNASSVSPYVAFRASKYTPVLTQESLSSGVLTLPTQNAFGTQRSSTSDETHDDENPAAHSIVLPGSFLAANERTPAKKRPPPDDLHNQDPMPIKRSARCQQHPVRENTCYMCCATSTCSDRNCKCAKAPCKSCSNCNSWGRWCVNTLELFTIAKAKGEQTNKSVVDEFHARL